MDAGEQREEGVIRSIHYHNRVDFLPLYLERTIDKHSLEEIYINAVFGVLRHASRVA